MRKFFQSSIAVVVMPLMTGCAYFTNYTRSVDFQERSYALDVKQRVVFAQDRLTLNGEGKQIVKRVICAEPSPDALTVISASAGVSAANAISAGVSAATSNSANQNVNVTAALAEQGAFVGLRTQSIQLLRDTMYRLCEGYAAGAIDEEEFTAMQRRYQSTMMGLLAIEQLTRPVVAAQVVLASNATSQAGASAGDAAVDKAQTRVDEKTADDVQARVDLEKARIEERASRKALDDNQQQAQAARSKAERETAGDAAAKKAAGNDAAKPFGDARAELEATHIANQEKVQAANIRAASAASARAAAERDLQTAKTKATAMAAGDGRIGAVREASAQMTSDLTNGVKEIVSEINTSYMRDSCFTLIARMMTRSDKAGPAGTPLQSQDAITACVGIIQNEEKRIKAQMDFEQQRFDKEKAARTQAIADEEARRQQILDFERTRQQLLQQQIDEGNRRKPGGAAR